MNIDDIVKLTGKRRDHVLRDSRKMLTKLYGSEAPDKDELTPYEVFAMIVSTSYLPLADALIPHPHIMRYAKKGMQMEIMRCERIIKHYQDKMRYHKPRGNDCSGYEQQIKIYQDKIRLIDTTANIMA
jgi:hypothetical protein